VTQTRKGDIEYSAVTEFKLYSHPFLQTKRNLMGSRKSVFVIDLTYVVDLSEVDVHIPAHIEFLDQIYEQGLFLASGAKVPRTGGIILAIASSREALEAKLLLDPFKKEGLAKYQITEFHASKHKSNFFD